MAVRDHLGEWLKDEDFAKAFGVRGRPGYSPVALALVTVLQQAENLTDRPAGRAAREEPPGLEVPARPSAEGVFDHTVLPEFRKKVAEAELERVALDALLERLKEEGLLRAGGKQRTDSTGVIAAVAALNRLELAGESMRAALDALAAAAPGWTMSVLDESWMPVRNTGHLVAAPDDREEAQRARDRLRGRRVRAAGRGLRPGVPGLAAEHPRGPGPRAVLLQNYVIVTGEDGTEVVRRREKSVREGGDGLPPGDKRIASPRDPGARWSVKRGEFRLGRKLHITETCDDRPPCDCGGKCRKGCAAAAFPNLRLGIALVGPLLAGTSPQGRAGNGCARPDFAIDYDAGTVTCPRGKASVSWSPCAQHGKPEIVVKFSPAGCGPCPARALCFTGKTRDRRQLTLNPRSLAEAQAASREQEKTRSFQADYARRAGIEGTMAQAVRHGARRARYRGLEKTSMEHAFMAVALNLIRLHAYWNGTPLNRGSMTHLARLELDLAALPNKPPASPTRPNPSNPGPARRSRCPGHPRERQ